MTPPSAPASRAMSIRKNHIIFSASLSTLFFSFAIYNINVCQFVTLSWNISWICFFWWKLISWFKFILHKPLKTSPVILAWTWVELQITNYQPIKTQCCMPISQLKYIVSVCLTNYSFVFIFLSYTIFYLDSLTCPLNIWYQSRTLGQVQPMLARALANEASKRKSCYIFFIKI